jgi:hypothetical protein
MDVEDEIRRATNDLDKALAQIRVAKPGKGTAGHEAVYGQAYQFLVRLGAKQQLKKKYR